MFSYLHFHLAPLPREAHLLGLRLIAAGQMFPDMFRSMPWSLLQRFLKVTRARTFQEGLIRGGSRAGDVFPASGIFKLSGGLSGGGGAEDPCGSWELPVDVPALPWSVVTGGLTRAAHKRDKDPALLRLPPLPPLRLPLSRT